MNKNAKSAASAALLPRPRVEGDSLGRRQAIVECVGLGAVGSQAELAQQLEARGFFVTQATLSRDLKALRIGKAPAPGGAGYVYVLPAPPHEVVDQSRSHWELGAFVREIRLVGNLVLVRTPPGNAQGVGRVLDQLAWPEVQGTISGDDTIMVVTLSAAQAQLFQQRLAELMGRRPA